MEKPRKMSKSGGNAIGVDELVRGVHEVERGYEFRLDGRTLNAEQVQHLGVYRAFIGTGLDFTSNGEVLARRGDDFLRNGRLITHAEAERLGAWHDPFRNGDYFTAERFGKRAVFLHQCGNPDPCLFAEDGVIREQHGDPSISKVAPAEPPGL